MRKRPLWGCIGGAALLCVAEMIYPELVVPHPGDPTVILDVFRAPIWRVPLNAHIPQDFTFRSRPTMTCPVAYL